MMVQELVAYLKSKRGITAEVAIERSPDGRAYGRFIEGGIPWPKETTFAIRQNGSVFDLAFFRTYHGAVTKASDAAIYANLPPAERRTIGYGPASTEPVENGGHSVYRSIIDALDARLRSGVTASGIGLPNTKSPVVNNAARSDCRTRTPSSGTRKPQLPLRTYFEDRSAQIRSLDACRNFLGEKGWPLEARLRLYDYSRSAFHQGIPPSEALISFGRMYDELVLPAPAGGWGVARNAQRPLWTADKAFETIRREFAGFAWGGSLTLANIRTSDTKGPLLSSINALKDIKPITGYPVMAVSKFLHPYNPELFPIYDNEVIANRVIPRFRNDFRAFCHSEGLSDQVGNIPEFYISYIFWGASLLQCASAQFMEGFAQWFGKQSRLNLAQRPLDACRLYATAFELTIIGAYADSLG